MSDLSEPDVPISNHGADLALTLSPQGGLVGRFPADATSPSVVEIWCDGGHFARVPVLGDAAGAGFSLDLPTVASPRTIEVEVRGEGEACLGTTCPTVVPRTNGFGLAASRVRDVYDRPLFSVPWMSFDGARLVIAGSHLPPAGDPSRLAIRFGPGVAYELAYPLPSPEFANHFWYWPNAGFSSFQITIDLPSSAPRSDPFSFEFADADGFASSDADAERHRIGRRVCVPHRLDSAICFPRDATQLTRVQTWSDDQTVTFTGYSNFRTIEALFARHGLNDGPGVRVLDWGCGHGRVTRHLLRAWPNARIAGADVDRQNIEWCRAHLGEDFMTLPLRPPTTIADASFDGIFGISVMTHLTAEVQDAWLAEIARILKPGGIALISFSGRAAAAFSSVFRTPEWWERWIETGFDDQQHDPALDGRIGDDAYYRNTLQSPEYTRRVWGRRLDLVDIYPSAIGYQDVAVLRRQDRAT